MKKLDPRALIYFFIDFFIQSAAFALLVIVVIGLFMAGRAGIFINASGTLNTDISQYIGFIYYLAGLFLIYLVLVFIWAIFYYSNYGYELTADSVKQQIGVISRKYTGIPYDNIQDVDIYQDVLMRILGIGMVSIETASKDPGEAGTGTTLFALSISDAQALRDEIMKKVDEHR